MIEGILQNGIYYRINDFVSDNDFLVFIHGLSGSSSAWLPYEAKFSKDYNVVFFDLRGHGKSIKYGKYSDYKINKNTEDLCTLLDFLKINKFHLVSHSYGAMVALDFLSKYQHRVKSTVFLSPGVFVVRRKLAENLKPFINIAKLFEHFPFNKKPGEHIDYNKYKKTGDWNLRRMWADATNTSLRVYLYCSRQAYDFDRADFFKNITTPTLIVHGKKDTVFPVENSQQIAKIIKHSQFVTLNDADHIVVLNNFHEVSELIENFLS